MPLARRIPRRFFDAGDGFDSRDDEKESLPTLNPEVANALAVLIETAYRESNQASMRRLGGHS